MPQPLGANPSGPVRERSYSGQSLAVDRLSLTRALTSSDIPALQTFTCTNPDRKLYDPHRGKYHPRGWELDVQSHARGLRVPPSDGDVVRVLEGPDGQLAGVSLQSRMEAPFFHVVQLIAVSNEHRGKGVGRRLLEDALQQLADEPPGSAVLARIDHRNEPSKALFAKFGFEMIGSDQEEPQLETWLYLLDTNSHAR